VGNVVEYDEGKSALNFGAHLLNISRVIAVKLAFQFMLSLQD
jgi:hypothetical protein